MHRLLIVASLLLGSTAAGADEGWVELFNGRNLDGWETVGKQSWEAVDGVLACTGEGAGWLSTVKEYGDFELELEFWLPPAGNSGVFLRAPREGNPAYNGLEIQVLDDRSEKYEDLRPEQFTGSVYDVVAASQHVTRPAGEWNTMRIVCRGPHIEVALNGVEVVNADLDKYPDKDAEHPGLKRKRGYIGLQNHSSIVQYRNIRLKELP